VFEDVGGGDHVVEGLFALGEAGHDVADAEGNHARDNFGEETPGGATEGEALAVEVGDVDAENLLAPGGLFYAAFEISVVEPRDDGANDGDGENQREKAGHGRGFRVGRCVGNPRCSSQTGEKGGSAQERKSKNEHGDEHGAEDEGVNEVRQEAKPEAGVGRRLGKHDSAERRIGRELGGLNLSRKSRRRDNSGWRNRITTNAAEGCAFL